MSSGIYPHKLGWKHSEITKKKLSIAKLRTRNPNWGGGKLRSNGYVYILKPDHPYCKSNGYVLEHRLVVEKKLGRYLKLIEIIHHINGIRNDNRVDNLMVIQRGQHKQYHKNSYYPVGYIGCKIEGCNRKHSARHMCANHYNKWLLERR